MSPWQCEPCTDVFQMQSLDQVTKDAYHVIYEKVELVRGYVANLLQNMADRVSVAGGSEHSQEVGFIICALVARGVITSA